MSNEQVAKAASKANQAPAPTSFDLSLDEFCARLSGSKVGPEMIGGFYQAQKAAEKTNGSDADFSAAFAIFEKQPA